MTPIVESLRIGPEKNFCYLITCPDSGAAALVDPAFEFDRVAEWVNSHTGTQPQVRYLLATHGHWDHAGGMREMLIHFPHAMVCAGFDEMNRFRRQQLPFHRGLRDGEKLVLGQFEIETLHTPGHTEGGSCYKIGDYLLTGDTLFVGQCGRTDLEGGSDEALFKSLQKIKTLDQKLIVLPGHDYGKTPRSTIEGEIKTNPTMMAKTLEDFINLP